MRPRGFTLIELVVAIAIGGVVLLGARALWESLALSVDRLSGQARVADAQANGDRLLRSVLGRLEVGTDQSKEFAGDPGVVSFTTWCDVPAGWQERCDARLSIENASDSDLALVLRLSTGENVTLRRGIHVAALRYLNDPVASGVWFRVWGRGITAPLAVGVIADGDTAIVRIGERG